MSNVVDATRYLGAMQKARDDAAAVGFPEPRTIDEANAMYAAVSRYVEEVTALRAAANLDVLEAIVKAGGDPRPQLVEALRATLEAGQASIRTLLVDSL